MEDEEIVIGSSSQHRGQQLYKSKTCLLYILIKFHCSLSLCYSLYIKWPKEMGFGRFLQSIPQTSWMCKKIRKVQHKTAYYQSSRICWEISILHCQLPILTSCAFHQSKDGTELLLHCDDVRPRNWTKELKWSVIYSMFSSVQATTSLCTLRICSHWQWADCRTANSWPSIRRSRVGNYHQLLSAL